MSRWQVSPNTCDCPEAVWDHEICTYIGWVFSLTSCRLCGVVIDARWVPGLSAPDLTK